MSGIFNSGIFNNSVFNTGQQQDIAVKTGTGGIDPEDKRYRIYKPTGLLERKKKGKEGVEQRIVESRDIHREVFEVFDEVIKRQTVDFKPMQSMTSKEVDREIGLLMREKMIAQEEEEMVILMAMLNE